MQNQCIIFLSSVVSVLVSLNDFAVDGWTLTVTLRCFQVAFFVVYVMKLQHERLLLS